MTHTVCVGIGSNIDPETSILAGLDALDAAFGLQAVSGVYRSAAVGFEGAPFLNLAARLTTDLAPDELLGWIRQTEFANGRRPDCPKFSSRRLDIDILTFDQLHGIVDGIELPRPEIRFNAFVLAPLAEIAPNLCLAGWETTPETLWRDFPKASQPLEPVQTCWKANDLPWHR